MLELRLDIYPLVRTDLLSCWQVKDFIKTGHLIKMAFVVDEKEC